MEQQEKMDQQGSRKGKKAKKKTQTFTNTDPIFPLLLAASLSNSTNQPTIQNLLSKCLKKLHLHLLSKPGPDPQDNLLLSLLPSLLTSKNPKIARRGAEIVGAASLLSLEMNELIALDGEITKALVSELASSSRAVSMAACNSLLDLSTTSIGRQRLLQSFALERLLFVFFQVSVSSTSVSLCSEDRQDVSLVRIALRHDVYFVSILQAAVTLINTCNIQQLGKVPRTLSRPFLIFMKNLWGKVHEQMLHGKTLKSCQGRQLHLSNIRVNDLAESIFRLSINASEFVPLPCAMVKRRIFESEASFETFVLNYWEAFPFHARRPSKSVNEEGDIFAPFAQILNCKESSPTFLPSMLQTFISCPPIGSDELDILNFLEEVRKELGCLIMYQQDIRVLRTEKQSKRELHKHFSDESSDPVNFSIPHCFSMTDIIKWEEAYKEGYTIALRGMGFRFMSIAAIADALASLFGQPSVGTNMYLTPPSCQGLACHFDDHCVFVFQLIGTKQWKLFARSNFPLPRLYDSLGSPCDLEAEFRSTETRDFLLREGDVLYIPRGVAHEACGGADGPFSMHLTFSIEIEPPFEWEGFAHVALWCWNQMQSEPHYGLVESSSRILDIMSVNFLHAVIELIGASDPTFRKACLVGALPSPLALDCWLNLSQKAIFQYVINKISTASKLSDVLCNVEMAIEQNEDPFERMRWLQHLKRDRETVEQNYCNMPFSEFRRLLPVYVRHRDMAEAAFLQVKSKFCSEVLFENVIDTYKMLLDRYKKTRTQYTNGMLSLHCQ